MKNRPFAILNELASRCKSQTINSTTSASSSISSPVMASSTNSTDQSPNITIYLSIKLDSTNNPLWLAQIKPLLNGRNLTGYVDGTLPCPPCFKTNEEGQLTDEVNPAYRTWIAQDQMVLGWINNSLTPAVLATVARSTHSFYTWSTLAKRFASQSQNRILQLRGELLRTMRGTKSISDFLDTINSIADNLALAGSPMSDSDLVSIIMNNVGPLYENTVSSAQARDGAVAVTSQLHNMVSNLIWLFQLVKFGQLLVLANVLLSCFYQH